MAKIEKKTADSITKNGYLLETISRERIWDEIKKSFTQSKDFKEYLKYLSDFNLYQYIFPGSNINTKLVKSNDFVVVIANLFKNEPLNRLETKLVQDYKIESDTAKKVIFLLNMLSMKVEDVFQMFKKKEQCFITDTTISEWLNVNKISDFRVETLKFKPSVSAEELMAKGITGRDLGIKIKELEVENFKKLL